MKTSLLKKAAILVTMLLAFITEPIAAFTAVMSGNWSSAATWGGIAPGATVTNQDIIIPSSIIVNLDMDVSFAGLLNTFTVDGQLNSSTNNSVSISQGSLAGSGMVDVYKLEFTSILCNMSFSGTLNADHFRDSGAALTLGATVLVNDTLNLDAGSIVLNSGSNLQMMSNSTIRINNGSMTIGGGVFNSASSYNVLYVGTSKTSGIEINTTTLNHLYVMLNDNSQTLTLGGNLIVNGNTAISGGQLNFSGRNLTLNGNLNASAGTSFNSNGTSNLTIGGSSVLSSGFSFASGSSINNFTINHGGSPNTVMLLSALGISGTLKLTSGSFSLENGSSLVMNSGSLIQVDNGSIVMNSGTFTGTAAYDVEYIGGTTTSGIELTGSGLNNLTVNMSSSSAYVSLDNDVTIAGNLNLQNGSMSIDSNKVTVNGTFDQNASASIMGGFSSDLELNLNSSLNDTLRFKPGGANSVLHDLTLNSGSGTTVYLGSDLTIGNILNFSTGKLDIGDNSLIIYTTGMITNYSSTKYVVTSGSGALRMRVINGAPFVVFPVGTSSGFSPASIQQNILATGGNFEVRTMTGVYANGTSGYNSAEFGSVVDRTWMINTVGSIGVNAIIRLGWLAGDEVNGFDRNNAYITHHNGIMWDTYANDASYNGVGGTYELERTGITSLGPFAVVDSIAGLVLGVDEKEKPSSLEIYPNPGTDVINIVNPTDNQTYVYELVDITGRVIRSVSNNYTSNSFSITGLNSGYYFIKITNKDSKKVITKRFIKE